MSDAKTLFLHVGCRKSGTSTLQLALRNSVDALREVGLDQPLGSRGGVMRGLVKPAQSVLGGDETTLQEARATLAGVVEAIRDSPHQRHLMSLEALAELHEEGASLIVEELRGRAGLDLRVVVTVRPYALTLPSEWQQRIKSRFSRGYLEYVDAVVSPEGADPELARESADFHRRQDVADVVRRWRAADPGLPVDVVLVPSTREASPGLFDMFCEVLSIDPGVLTTPPRHLNESLSHPDAEALRLVNLALGERLPNLRGNYRWSVRKWIGVGSMMRGSSTGARVRLPAHLEPWARTQSERQLAELDAAGVRLLGDRDGFVHPTLRGTDFEPATDADVARAAAAVLADLAEQHARQRARAERKARKAKKAKQRKQEQRRESRAAAAATPPAGAPGRVRRRLGRLVSGG